MSPSAGSGRSLVVVESPAKARTISGILGSEYEVKASVGHVRDLPKSDLGVDVESGFQPKYVLPREIDMQLVDAQQARRVLDRLVGYRLSPFLWKQIKRGLSAGRVQSVAVR